MGNFQCFGKRKTKQLIVVFRIITLWLFKSLVYSISSTLQLLWHGSTFGEIIKLACLCVLKEHIASYETPLF